MAKRIGELLIEANVLTKDQLEQALVAQQADGRKLGQVLVELKLVTELQLAQTLSRQLSIPWVSLHHVEFTRNLLNAVSRELADKYTLVPIFFRKVRKGQDTLYIAMDDPTNDAAIQDVSRACGLPVRPMIACPTDIRSVIRAYYFGETPAPSTAASAQGSSAKSGTSPGAPPLPKDRRPTVPEVKQAIEIREQLSKGEKSMSSNQDSPDSEPEIEAREITPKARRPVIALTLLDGTTIQLPTPKSIPPVETPTGRRGEELTTRDLISALRAVSHGADASEILGEKPPQWEAMVAALLSLLLKRGLISDWEFVEEYRKV